MSSSDEVNDGREHRKPRAPDPGVEAGAAENEPIEAVWKPPQRSDQAPGEETVQVNDTYTGGDAPPAEESPGDDEQHPTGG